MNVTKIMPHLIGKTYDEIVSALSIDSAGKDQYAIKEKLAFIGGISEFDCMSLETLKANIAYWESQHPEWSNLYISMEYDYDDSIEYYLIGTREETKVELQARITREKAFADSKRSEELALLIKLKAKYEQ